MSLIGLERRLVRLEAAQRTGTPAAILTDRPIGDATGDLEVADAVARWQLWVAEGKASARNGVLYLIGPKITANEWAVRYLTKD